MVSTYINETQSLPTVLGPYDFTYMYFPDMVFLDAFLQPPDTGDIFGADGPAVENTDHWLKTFFTGNATIYTDNYSMKPHMMFIS